MASKTSCLCDIFIGGELRGELLKDHIFQSVLKISIEKDRIYSGFLNLNIGRIAGVTAVTRLRTIGIHARNIPIRYRDEPHISARDAERIANSKSEKGYVYKFTNYSGYCPVYWWLSAVQGFDLNPGAGNAVDKVDGHIWTHNEIDEFEHDYNNNLFS